MTASAHNNQLVAGPTHGCGRVRNKRVDSSQASELPSGMFTMRLAANLCQSHTSAAQLGEMFWMYVEDGCGPGAGNGGEGGGSYCFDMAIRIFRVSKLRLLTWKFMKLLTILLKITFFLNHGEGLGFFLSNTCPKTASGAFPKGIEKGPQRRLLLRSIFH